MNVCLLLAAGSSSRMQSPVLPYASGREAIPKMLLPFNGKTLLQHAIDEIKKLHNNKLLVVTGCYHNRLKEILEQQQIEFVQNEKWKDGMGSSIQTGINYMLTHFGEATSVIILVCDQPFISADLLQQMMDTKSESGKGIIASTYNDTIGTPVLFEKKYFDQLAVLRGQTGAKKLIQQFAADAATVGFPLGAVDIDTPEDFEKLSK